MRTHRYVWALGAVLLASCADYGAPDSVVFGEVVYTQPLPGFDFSTLPRKTYYLDTTIAVREDDNSTTAQMPSAVVTTITGNMTALGYTRVVPADSSQAAQDAAIAQSDVGLKMAVLKGTGTVYYPGYWCDYWYYYSCYYGWSYAGTYSFGSAILEMGDLSTYSPPPNPPSAEPLKVLWGSMAYGVATTNAYDTQRVVDALNRAFDQSPYLDVNP